MNDARNGHYMTSEQVSIGLSALGVIANFLLALVAVVVPWWQRRKTISDERTKTRDAWKRFIASFAAVADAQGKMLAACGLDGSASCKAFKEAELQLRSAIQALAVASAASIPVEASLNAATVQQLATKTLAHFPDVTLYGSGYGFGTVKPQMEAAALETIALLERTKALMD